MKQWEFANIQSDRTRIKVKISGTLRADAFGLESLRRNIDTLRTMLLADLAEVEIHFDNSVGPDAAGREIMAILRNHPCRKTVIATGTNLGGSEIVIDDFGGFNKGRKFKKGRKS